MAVYCFREVTGRVGEATIASRRALTESSDTTEPHDRADVRGDRNLTAETGRSGREEIRAVPRTCRSAVTF